LTFASLAFAGIKLLARRLNVYVDFPGSSTSKQSSPEKEHRYQYNDHKNYEHSDNSHTTAAATFFGHEGSSFDLHETNQGADKKG